MRNMRPIAEHKLQLMGARRQRDHCFGLPIAKVPVLIVRHDRLLATASIDEKMMVPGIGFLDSGGRHAYA